MVRAVEILYAFDEALRLIGDYEPPGPPAVRRAARRGGLRLERGAPGDALAPLPPRGRRLDRRRADRAADLAEPARIEQDLREFVEPPVSASRRAAAVRCEQAIRNYDPCISCSTHFLQLDVDRA